MKNTSKLVPFVWNRVPSASKLLVKLCKRYVWRRNVWGNICDYVQLVISLFDNYLCVVMFKNMCQVIHK